MAPAPPNATTLPTKPAILGDDSSNVGTETIKPMIPPTAKIKAIILGIKSKSIIIFYSRPLIRQFHEVDI